MRQTFLANNPKAKFDYEILETFEAGLVLSGQEVKSARQGRFSLKGSYAAARQGEIWLLGSHLAPYSKAGAMHGYDPERSRKLLLKKSEIKKLIGRLQTERLTLIPLKVYTKGRRLKIALGLGRGKRQYEKKEIIKKTAINREIQQALRKKE
ncbi:MAG: SsrA-binding protein SmpB [bacterium]|nr:SsrA-binding protein SmpB [bacterium]